MIRLAIFAVAFLGAGVAIGWIAAPSPHSATPEVEIGAAVPVTAPSVELEALKADRDRLEAENEDLVGQITLLLDQQAQWPDAASRSETTDQTVGLSQPQPTQDRERSRSDDNSEDEQQRREAYARENARRMQEFEDWIASQITDPKGIERYNDLMQWREYQDELRQQYRDADTDAERDAIRAKLDEGRRSARQLVEDQQDTILRGIASANGVTDTAKQTEFVAAMRQAMESPFFELESMLSGGGPSRGFPFGGGRGGGRPPGQFQSGDGN